MDPTDKSHRPKKVGGKSKKIASEVLFEDDEYHKTSRECTIGIEKERWSEIRETSHIDNVKFNACYTHFFLFIHCISAFYYGFSMTAMNNLGRPILEQGMGVDPDDVDSWLGTVNLGFGIGKMFGSVIAGSIQKIVGKLGTLYVAEPIQIISVVLQIIPNIWCFFIGRVLNGAYCGFNTTTAPRLIIECYPTAQRGYKTSIYSLAVCVGVASSFSQGYAFGDKLNDYWQYFVVGPYVIALLRMVFVYFICNHETPLQYYIFARNAKTQQKKQEFIEKGEVILKKFNKTVKSEAFEKKLIVELIDQSDKSQEKSMKDLLYLNVFSKKARWACIAVIAFNSMSAYMGQTFNENYTTAIFDKFKHGYGYELTFYSSFGVLLGGFLGVLCIEKTGRQTLIIWGFQLQIICMWVMSVAFYFYWVVLASAANILYSFSLYFTIIATAYVWTNEVSQPFVCGLGICFSWISKSIVAAYQPFIYDSLPLYWTPQIQSISGLFLFILCRPVFLESQGKSLNQMTKSYADFKYNILSRG